MCGRFTLTEIRKLTVSVIKEQKGRIDNAITEFRKLRNKLQEIEQGCLFSVEKYVQAPPDFKERYMREILAKRHFHEHGEQNHRGNNNGRRRIN